ncbi:conserved hypothetical protein [Desulforapulum autotrophicum HRM2]|uniref:Uncharacterized protein n=2 Tax=Desulforapulum autotrophicum TaxID=2296 RepID=C0QBI0_DESAH|nr:conserved hypothetical protein [Desulforapulum autotrophicum HRM2]
MEKCVTKQFDNITQKMREAQIQLLYRQTWTGLIGVLIVTLTSCVAFWHVVPQWKLSLWAGISVLVTLIRGYIIFAFQQRAPLIFDINRWATLHVLGVLVSGLMWAIPPVFLWPTDSVYQLVWPVVILPLSAAAVATYYTWTLSYTSFVFLTVLPLSLRFFYEGGVLMNILGLLSLFFIAVLLRAGSVMHTASVCASEIGIRNEILNNDLNKGIVAREQLNEQLHLEIAERILSEKKLGKQNQELLRLNGELTSTTSNLELANRKLEDAIADINQLSGMLPICSFCKNIRNDQGYYEQIEEYIHKHSGVDFSHTICPSCIKKYYPEEYEDE